MLTIAWPVLGLVADVRARLDAAPCHDAHIMCARGHAIYPLPVCLVGSGALADATGKEPNCAIVCSPTSCMVHVLTSYRKKNPQCACARLRSPMQAFH